MELAKAGAFLISMVHPVSSHALPIVPMEVTEHDVHVQQVCVCTAVMKALLEKDVWKLSS
ncbi:hypothetical protein DPMN_071967 [Dreissena polymorpha]|uniref:Uncharacterized protein n=1 Tax=Dreissena polymorpha TaxID=45954 RepID=A0A9D3Z8T6_DREPO|nr:hypothetical protein DPMN_071967 [Dreissena polymorpha]